MRTKISELAINGGPKAVQTDLGDIFTWPIITEEDEQAALEVLRAGKMSDLDVTMKFEEEFAAWHDVKYALAHNTGTAALHTAMFGCHVGVGDEIICPSLTYWASALPAFSLGATIVYAEVDPNTVTIDPADIEHRITDRTKAIIAVHYQGYPCDMDPIMEIANKHGVKVIEDASHAHGGLYKGKLIGTIGHVGAFSIMSGKALPCGEGGIVITNDREIYERAVAFGHYRRTRQMLERPDLKPYAGLPLGGCKYRMHQISSAVARVQLRHYKERMAEIQKAMNYFWDLLEGVPGLRALRPPEGSDSTMGGWYSPHGLYVAEELGGLSIHKFCEAVRAEGITTYPGHNLLMHLHPMLNEADIYGHGKPTRIANSDRDVRQPKGSLPVTETMPERIYSIPWFKHYRPRIIEEHAEAFRKVARHADELNIE
ncbi:MAG: DegT/DnrJ/EryC1/StrS family aminotransferase [Chloroflexota bacterium]|nr:DegT/DnrJ/EryC1/StrS family aminotransferase [Chloroflexota bacterium]